MQRFPNELLRYERTKRNWTLEDVAEKIDVSEYKTVERWELGQAMPHLKYRQELAELYGKSQRELGLIKGEIPFCNVPFSHNLFFTGRESILMQLHTIFASMRGTTLSQPLALSGLAGVGKTQAAREFAHRYQEEYHTVLWLSSKTRELLTSEFASLALFLRLVEKDEKDQDRMISAMQSWLARLTRWLLIFDDIDDVRVLRHLLPSKYKGHILVTTLRHATGTTAQAIMIDAMTAKEGGYFLLKRAKIIHLDTLDTHVSHTNREQAEAISRKFGGLPLALDQAGAYIEETGCSLVHYLTLCQTKLVVLLKRRGSQVTDHADSVSTTFSLSFEKIINVHCAADLLYLMAYLAPHAIPEEIFLEGAPHVDQCLRPLEDPVVLDAAREELLRYSLVQYNSNAKWLSIHRLMQVVVQNEMEKETQRQWAERVVKAVNQVFPDVENNTWSQCQRLLSHAQVCAGLIQKWDMLFPEAARLLEMTGCYLRERGQYPEAEQLLCRALALHNQIVGHEHLDTARNLYNLGRLYLFEGKYEQAKSKTEQALLIRSQELGEEHADVAITFTQLGRIDYRLGDNAQAENSYIRAMKIVKGIYGPLHPIIRDCLNNLALVFHAQGEYEQAKLLYQQVRAILENIPGQNQKERAALYNNLARVYQSQERYQEAEELYQQAIAFRQEILGKEHPDTAIDLNNLATLYEVQQRYSEAESLYLQALDIWKKMLGEEHTYTASGFCNLGRLYVTQGKYEEAEWLLQKALMIRKRKLGSKHPDTATSLDWLGVLYHHLGRLKQAETFHRSALTIREQNLVPEHPDLIYSLEHYANLLVDLGRKREAEEKMVRARTIRSKSHKAQTTEP